MSGLQIDNNELKPETR